MRRVQVKNPVINRGAIEEEVDFLLELSKELYKRNSDLEARDKILSVYRGMEYGQREDVEHGIYHPKYLHRLSARERDLLEGAVIEVKRRMRKGEV